MSVMNVYRYSDKHDCEYDYKAVARDMTILCHPEPWAKRWDTRTYKGVRAQTGVLW